jgi:hypothetical protein
MPTQRAGPALVLYERIRSAAQGACSFYWFKTDA